MRTLRALAAIGLVLTLAACGEDDGGSSDSARSSRTEHNAADVAFAADMIQHHAQALSMVDLTMDRRLDPEVQALADDIRAAQAPEIERMSDWLEEWGEEIPETVRDHANAHGDGHDAGATGGDMPGMMSADEMAELADAPDAEFQEQWLETMKEHHEGAVQMAEAQQEDGRYRPALDLAEEIATAQTEEIETIDALLSSQ
jgi:uncharacterized protein (DUF305 family)